jgi:hypothetical protein
VADAAHHPFPFLFYFFFHLLPQDLMGAPPAQVAAFVPAYGALLQGIAPTVSLLPSLPLSPSLSLADMCLVSVLVDQCRCKPDPDDGDGALLEEFRSDGTPYWEAYDAWVVPLTFSFPLFKRVP